ncbi:hypothetical protein [Candidatus Magnetobacterium casense]|uniref:hypothetical protein n=1 Tax=Candidatus Magnetobacterium casense TaxID=1455061 RepID=UPI0012DCB6A8|nr:hypothetical protein [Candidatus Magnetobacterium casensis]
MMFSPDMGPVRALDFSETLVIYLRYDDVSKECEEGGFFMRLRDYFQPDMPGYSSFGASLALSLSIH